MNENDKVAGLPELAKSVIWMINFAWRKKITVFINWNDFCGNYDATATKYRKFWFRLWIG